MANKPKTSHHTVGLFEFIMLSFCRSIRIRNSKKAKANVRHIQTTQMDGKTVTAA